MYSILVYNSLTEKINKYDNGGNVIILLHNKGEIDGAMAKINIHYMDVELYFLTNKRHYSSTINIFEENDEIVKVNVMNESVEGYTEYEHVISPNGYFADDDSVEGLTDYLCDIAIKLLKETSRIHKAKNFIYNKLFGESNV